jgi:hypothetical protein
VGSLFEYHFNGVKLSMSPNVSWNDQLKLSFE